jgi:hypothetical protein
MPCSSNWPPAPGQLIQQEAVPLLQACQPQHQLDQLRGSKGVEAQPGALAQRSQ